MSEKINVHFELFGGLKTDKPKKQNLLLEESVSIRDILLKEYGFKEEHIKYLVFLANEKEVKLDYKLKNNDNIKVLLPMGGGEF